MNQYYYHFDGLGSIVELTDSSGNMVEKYFYDEYGNTTIKDASDVVLSQSAIENPYGFTGRRIDDETGLYYYRARAYSPELGRFLQADPFSYYDSMNLFQYVGNSPVNAIDPFGLAEIRVRPLENPIIRPVASMVFGERDRRGSHWQFFYSNGLDSGYLGDDSKKDRPRFGPDNPANIQKYNQEPIVKNLDDNILRVAEMNVQKRWIQEYKNGGRRYSYPENDCQTYIIEVFEEYLKISEALKKKEKSCR